MRYLMPMIFIISIGAAPLAAQERFPSPRLDRLAPAEMTDFDDNVIRPSLPGTRIPTDPRQGHRNSIAALAGQNALEQMYAKTVLTQIGGDDILVRNHPDSGISEVAIAEDGTIFVAVGNDPGGPLWTEYITVYRSTDGGTTFSLWGQIGDELSGVHRLRDLDVTVGSFPRLFVTYMVGGFSATVAFADPSANSATWTINNVMNTGVSFLNPDLATDNQTFDDYYVYLVSSAIDGNGDDIWFARSIDQGTTWETPYKIAELTSNGNLMYSWPRVCYGFGNTVHVLWTYTERLQGTFDDGVRYRQALDDAADAASWGSIYALAPTDDGFNQRSMDISASLTNGSVAALYSMAPVNGWDPQLLVSSNSGLNWLYPAVDLPLDLWPEIDFHLPSNEFRAVGLQLTDEDDRVLVLTRADASIPQSWSTPQQFSDQGNSDLIWSSLAFDPTHDGRVGAVVGIRSDDAEILFDAEWRNDPGYPVLEPGFPISLVSPPLSDPALVDLDADGDLEIVFGDYDGYIQVFHHDGNPAAGWPVRPGSGISEGPVAVGELVPGRLSVTAGTLDGRVFSYDPSGQVEPGWPFEMPDGGQTYVSIGALGGPYPRTLVACANENIVFLNYRGVSPLDTFGWTVPDRLIQHPAAFGDIDGDGINEAVFVANELVAAVQLYDMDLTFSRLMPDLIADSPSLGDLDGNGTAEILVPLVNGQLFALDGNGVDFGPGWPFSTPGGSSLNSPAIGQILGNGELEIAVTANDWTVHLLYQTGVEQSGYPVNTQDGWYILSSPIMGRVEGASSDVVVASRDKRLHAWDNFANVIPGWPKATSLVPLNTTPAMGDIDLDGRNEIVFLSDTELSVVDVGEAPGHFTTTWPMAMHDPQRTGCSDCPEDVVTDVTGEDPSRTTRVAFAGASPNPVAGSSTTFRFDLPVRAAASLEVYDLRGHLIRRLMKAEIPAGQHAAHWDGRDGGGRQVASGQYLARLKVQGPGLTQELTRRVTVVR